MLPYLKPKDTKVGVIVTHRKADGTSEEHSNERDQGFTACAEDIIRCINAGNAPGLANALRSLIEIYDSQTHTDSGENNFDSRNEKASDYNK